MKKDWGDKLLPLIVLGYIWLFILSFIVLFKIGSIILS